LHADAPQKDQRQCHLQTKTKTKTKLKLQNVYSAIQAQLTTLGNVNARINLRKESTLLLVMGIVDWVYHFRKKGSGQAIQLIAQPIHPYVS
jgi:hypothetical protein